MKSTLETLEGLNRKLNIEVPAEKVGAAFIEIYEGIKKNAEIKGFRKGKAPISKIRELYKDRVSQDVLQQLVAESYQEALTTHSLDPVTQPQLDIQSFDEDKDFVYSAQLEVRPEVKLVKVEGLEVEKEKLDFDEAKISEIVENMRKRMQEVQPILEDRPAQSGDVVKINFEGFIDGAPLENGKSDDFELELGSNTLIPGFEDGIVGMKVGAEKTLNLAFPEEYHVTELKGKPVDFKIRLNSLHKYVLPEINDDLAQKVSPEFKTMDELKDAIKKDMEEGEKKRIDEDLKDRLLKALAEENPVDVPDTLKEDQKHRLIHDIEHKLKNQGYDAEGIKEYKDRWSQDFEKTAEFMVQTSFLIDGIASKYELKVNPSDVEKRLNEMAQQLNVEIAKIKEFYKAQDKLSSLRFQIMEEKVVEFLISKAKITEVEKDKLTTVSN